MKSLTAIASACVVLLLTSCRPSPQKLLASANKYHENKKYKEASILYQKVIAKDKTNAEAYYREGLNLLDQHNPVEASKFLRRAIDLRPDNTDAEAKLAEIYLSAYFSNPRRLKSLLPEVADLKTKLLQRDANSYSGLRLDALLALANHKTEEALQGFTRANEAKPYSRDLVGWYAETLNSANQPEKAEALLRDMLAHDKTWGPGYDLLFIKYSRAKETGKAEAVLRERVQSDPLSAVALTNLSNFLLTMNRYDEAESIMKRVLQDRTAFPAGHEMLGDFYSRARKYDAALRQYEAGTHEDPASELKYNQRKVATYALMGRKSEALQLAKSLAGKDPKDTSSNEMYASLLLDTSLRTDPGKTTESMRKLVQNDPNNPVLHLDLARAYLLTNHSSKALTESLEAISQETKKRSGRPALLIPARLLAARIYESTGQHAQALDQTRQILTLQENNAEARLLRDEALIGLNESDQAQPDLEKLVEQVPQLNEAHLALGGIYVNQKNFGKATTQFEQVWKSSPPDQRGFVALQRLALAQGKTDEAVKAMTELADQNGNVPAYRSELAQFQTAAGEQTLRADPARARQWFEQAIANYKQVAKSNPSAVDVWLRLGVLQQQLHQSDSALASFEQASIVDPGNTQALVNRATILDGLGRKKEAADLYNKVLGINPNDALALNNLAFLNADNGKDLDQAMTFAERAKKQAPNSLDVSDTLGYVYLRKNLNAQALQIFRQNVQDRPQSATFHLHLAMALLKKGDKDGARSEADKALKIANPADQDKIRSFVGQIG